MLNFFLINVGKILSKIIRVLNLGNGSTWPGHIALRINKRFIREMLSGQSLRLILISGTNGKTTTAKLILTVLEESGKKVLQNQSGANLLNGIASALVLQSSATGRLNFDFALFEIDENALPFVLKEIDPQYLLLLNLFRDQLDRYGEVDEIVRRWKESLKNISEKTVLILNADDPTTAYFGKITNLNRFYFSLEKGKAENSTLEHASDSIYCPVCGRKLHYSKIYYSHLGIWACLNCGFKHPTTHVLSSFSLYPLSGVYNVYNTLAAVSVLRLVGLKDKEIIEGFRKFKPAFGRQEKIRFNDKDIQIFLSKNPTSFNESLRTVQNLGAKSVLFVLNDRIADGRDISWIWDIDLLDFENILVAGDRAYDMGLRIKYQDQRSKIKDQNYNSKSSIYEGLKEAIDEGLKVVPEKETLYIFPTYTAMLEVRKILTGKSIL